MNNKFKVLGIIFIVLFLFNIYIYSYHEKSTIIIAHRGASGYKTEHTFQAYDLANKTTKYLEQDVVLSKNNTLYVSHDLTPYRMTKTEKRPYSQLTDKEINQLKTIHTKTSYSEHIHTLQTVVNRYGHNVIYVIELKNHQTNIVNIIAKFIEKNQLQSNVIIQSFNRNLLNKVKQKLPNIKTMYLIQDGSNFRKGLNDPSIDIMSLSKNFLLPEYIKKTHKAKKKICFWTLNNMKDINIARKYHVDYVFTNYPDLE